MFGNKQKYKEYDDEVLKKVQQTELGILKDFVAVCEKYDLDYFGIAGTGIGALRHKGFIPWDDDIDVAMPRGDFERFFELVEEEFPGKYNVINAEKYEDYPLMTSRLCLKGTKFKEEALKNVTAPMGIFLDLYPMDKISDDPKEAKSQAFAAWFWSKILILKTVPFPMLAFTGIKEKLIHAACFMVHALLNVFNVSHDYIYKKAYEAETRYNHLEKCEKLDFLCDTNPDMNLYYTNEIYPLKKLTFEDIMLNFPHDMDRNLKAMYGDYMTPPPKEKQKNHYPYELEFLPEDGQDDSCRNIYTHTFAIPAYKESPYLESCVRSLKSQTNKDSDIIMVTSTPCSYISDIASQYDIPLYVNNTGKSGISGDWNFALEKASTDLVTIAHQDDIYLKSYKGELDRALSGYEKSEDMPLLLYCTDYMEIRNSKNVRNNLNLIIKRIGMFLLKFKAFQSSVFIRRRILSFGDMICCPSVTLNKNVLEDDFFNDRFSSDLDWEAWEKLSLRKGLFIYNSKVLMGHRIHVGSETTDIINSGRRTKEDLEMFRKFWPEKIAQKLTKLYSNAERSNEI